MAASPSPTRASSALPPNLECPKCGKHTIVQRKENLYCCINCDFKRDLDQSTQKSEADPFMSLLITLLTVVLLLALI
jgi:transcription elongation factor Elf1